MIMSLLILEATMAEVKICAHQTVIPWTHNGFYLAPITPSCIREANSYICWWCTYNWEYRRLGTRWSQLISIAGHAVTLILYWAKHTSFISGNFVWESPLPSRLYWMHNRISNGSETYGACRHAHIMQNYKEILIHLPLPWMLSRYCLFTLY